MSIRHILEHSSLKSSDFFFEVWTNDEVRYFDKLSFFKRLVGIGARASFFPGLTHLKDHVLTIPEFGL